MNKKIKCPYCKKSFIYQNSLFRPFCSEKCKMIDLGKWLNEDYTIPSDDSNEKESLNDTNDLDNHD